MIKTSEFLAHFARSESGAKSLKGASGKNRLIDRVDGIRRVSGGQRTLTDAAKLADGQRYARKKPGGFVPDLTDLLPKHLGERRRIRNYHKHRGRAYTLDQVMQHLQQMHLEAEQNRLRRPLGL